MIRLRERERNMDSERMPIVSKLKDNLKSRIDALTPDVSGEKAHHARILVITGIIFMMIGFVMFLTQVIQTILPAFLPAPLTDLILDFFTVLIGYAVIRLVHSGHIRNAGWVVLSCFLILATAQFYYEGNPTSDIAGVLALLICVSMAMILLDQWGRWVAFLLATITFVGMVLLWAAGYLPSTPLRDPGSGPIFSIIMWLTASSVFAILINSTTAILRNQTKVLQGHISNLGKMELELRESEERYRSLIENLGEGIGFVDIEERFTFANPAAHDIFGVSRGDLVGRDLMGFLDTENQLIMQSQTAQHQADQSRDYELDIVRPNGERRNLLITTTPQIDQESQYTGAFGVFRDITERVQIEEVLANERNLLHTLINSVPDFIFVKDTESRFVHNNDAHLHALGEVTQDEILDKTDLDIFPSEIASQYYADEQAVLQTGVSLVDREESYLDSKGNTGWLLTTKVPLRDTQGQIVGLVGISHDITERLRVQKVLRESEERFRALTSAAHDAIMTIDHEGKITFWNDAAMRIFGYTAQEVIGADLYALIVPEQYRLASARGLAGFKNTGQGGTIGQTIEMTALNRDETEFPIELSLSAFQIQEKWHAVGIIRDISERKRIEAALQDHAEHLEEMVEERTRELQETHEQLLRREKLAVLGQLAGSVTHDLRNPLGVISNAIYLLGIILTDPESEVQQTLEVLSNAVENADQIIESLLNFARTKAPDVQLIDINKVVEVSLSRIAVPQDPDVAVVCQLDETLPSIFADPIQLDRVFTNLILNAIQAMPEGGTLTIRSAKDHTDWVAVSIVDTGVGISEVNMQKLFQPLFTTKANGIGLGLALVMEIVEGNGGTIVVESELGVGSTFTVRLPIDSNGDRITDD